MIESYTEKEERELRRLAWMIRWHLAGMVKEPPSIDAILGKEKEPELSLEGLSELLGRINAAGKWKSDA